MRSALAHVVELLHEDRHGCAETANGLPVYFHELSVSGGLSCLAVGDEVSLVLEDRLDTQTVRAQRVERTGRRWSPRPKTLGLGS